MTTLNPESDLARTFPWARSEFDPPVAYAWMREQRPVTRVVLSSGKVAWLVTRYDDVRAILADERISADSRKLGFPYLREEMKRPDEHRSFLRMDGAEHQLF